MAINKKPLKFKQISQREVEWSSKNNRASKPILDNFKQVTERKVEWKNSSAMKDFVRFLGKLKSSKQPLTYISRFARYKFFKELNKEFPRSTVFLNRVLEKYPHNIKFMYAPGTLYIGPLLIANKFKVTEKILLELSKRNLSLQKILENEKVTMSILSKNFIFTDDYDKSKTFLKYLDKIEKEINGNK